MNTYAWTISALDCKPKEEGKTNVVVTAEWQVSATDGTHSAGACGKQSFTLDPSKPFISFDNLTEDQVVGWVQESLGIDAVTLLQERLDAQIEDLVNPPAIKMPLPWAP